MSRVMHFTNDRFVQGMMNENGYGKILKGERLEGENDGLFYRSFEQTLSSACQTGC